MTQPPISVTIITLNEEANLARALSSVQWADEVIVVDSGSSDRTVEIAEAKGAKVIHNPWPGYGRQKNFAMENATHRWVLNIDADEEVPPSLAEEIKVRLSSLDESPPNGFYFPRKTFYLGRWIRHGGWYPNHLVRLARKDSARWTEPHLHEQLLVDGQVDEIKSPLNHYTFAGIQDQVLTNLKFSRLGSKDLEKKGQKASLPLLLLKPFGKFIETYFLKLGVLDGLPGLIISINAAHSMFLKYAYLVETKLHEDAHH